MISKCTFAKRYFKNAIKVSNSLDPDQAQQNVGPDLGKNRLQRPSADDKQLRELQVNVDVVIMPSFCDLLVFYRIPQA